ncbi:hypothetical protein HDV00_004160 [Rhizophlyctis rosea]|nr:hypothetical protein HDV00_004160 [Rhizophlyctis rosea]
MPAKNLGRHFVLVATTILALCGWILDIIGISIQQNKRWDGYSRKNPISLYWFFTWFYFFTIIAFLVSVFRSTIEAYRLLLVALFSIAFVFTVYDTEFSLSLARSNYDPSNGAAVETAGTILLGITFLSWIITLGSSANSGLLKGADLTLPTTRPGRTQPETVSTA